MRETSRGPTFPSLAYWTPDGTKRADTAVGSDEPGALVVRACPNGVTIEVSRFDSTAS
jgi:hypothetical protein